MPRSVCCDFANSLLDGKFPYLKIDFDMLLGCALKLVTNYLVSWFITYLWDLQPSYIGVK